MLIISKSIWFVYFPQRIWRLIDFPHTLKEFSYWTETLMLTFMSACGQNNNHHILYFWTSTFFICHMLCTKLDSCFVTKTLSLGWQSMISCSLSLLHVLSLEFLFLAWVSSGNLIVIGIGILSNEEMILLSGEHVLLLLVIMILNFISAGLLTNYIDQRLQRQIVQNQTFLCLVFILLSPLHWLITLLCTAFVGKPQWGRSVLLSRNCADRSGVRMWCIP